MTPEEFRLQFMKNRGITLDTPPANVVQTVPITPTAAPPPVVPPQPIVPPPSPSPVVRTNPDGTLAGNVTSNRVDNPAEWVTPPVVAPASTVAAAPPVRPPSAFPAGGADAVPFSRPTVEPNQAGGLTLASNPVQGWGGTVG